MKIAVAVRVRPASSPSTLLAGPLLTSAGGRPDEVRIGTRAFRNWSSVVTGSDQQRAFDQLCTPLLRQLADGYAITAHYLQTFQIPFNLNPAGGCTRAPKTRSRVFLLENQSEHQNRRTEPKRGFGNYRPN